MNEAASSSQAGSPVASCSLASASSTSGCPDTRSSSPPAWVRRSSSAALRQRVEALLRQETEAEAFFATTELQAPLARAAEGVEARARAPAAPSEQPGTVIGRYKLLEQIGEGGFGTVWVAEQREPVKRRVELKWQEMALDGPMLDFNVISGVGTTQGVAYAVCDLRSEAEQSGLKMLVEGRNQGKTYLNCTSNFVPYGTKFGRRRSLVGEQVREEQGTLHEPAGIGGASRLPSPPVRICALAWQQPRPTRSVPLSLTARPGALVENVRSAGRALHRPLWPARRQERPARRSGPTCFTAWL